MIDVRFPTALQLMLSLTYAEAQGVVRMNSAALSDGVDSNASFVRKLLAPLVRDGLVDSAVGREGGLCLGRPADRISLLDIYRSVIGERPLWPSRADVPHRCLVSRNIDVLFSAINDETSDAMERSLAARTLASCFAELRRLDGREPSPRARRAHR